MKITDERLGELALLSITGDAKMDDDLYVALRELRDYRKAVREYLSAVDALKSTPFEGEEAVSAVYTAEANLRALQERT